MSDVSAAGSELEGSGVEEVDWEEMPVVHLEDDEGNSTAFEMLAILEIDDAAYAVLTPTDAPAEEGEPLEIQILHYEESDEGTFLLRQVEDEELAQSLFEVVSETLSEAAGEE